MLLLLYVASEDWALRVIIENSQASPSEQGAGKSEGAATIYINMSCHVTLQIWADGHHHDAFPLLSSLPQDGGQTYIVCPFRNTERYML